MWLVFEVARAALRGHEFDPIGAGQNLLSHGLHQGHRAIDDYAEVVVVAAGLSQGPARGKDSGYHSLTLSLQSCQLDIQILW